MSCDSVETVRCDWANGGSLERIYHDTEWGIPVHDDLKLFKMLILEGKQAGLSWSTILKKMATLCHAFDDFNPYAIADYGDDRIEKLLTDPGIIRNRLKVAAVVNNSKRYLELIKNYGSFDGYLWKYVDFRPLVNNWQHVSQVPSSSPVSDEISRDLKKLGFKFVGTTIIYSFMQAAGMVNDHLVSCSFRRG